MTIPIRVNDEEKDLAFISGYVIFSFTGRSSQLIRDEVKIPAGSTIRLKWQNVDFAVPTVSLASIFNDGPANNAGWAVDYTKWDLVRSYIELTSSLAVRDTDGHIKRLSYHVTALGN